MFRVSVMYPNDAGAEFDHDYYNNTHMKMVEEHMKPFGLIKSETDKGVSGGGDQPAPYIGVGQLYFESLDGYDKAIAAHGALLRGDIPNFTNVMPIRQISEILE
jgi:uncharacterized protein (TIGR02118 family)